jgi:hypothetical protein
VDAPIRGVALLRACVGAALTVFAGRVASAAEGRPAAPFARLFTRVLGVRQLAQATLTLTAPQLLTPSRGALVDGLHTATVTVLAAVSPRHRRAALMNAALAAAFCGLGVVGVHEQAREQANEQRVMEVEPAREVPPMLQQHAAREPERPRRELPQDANQFSLGLGDDSNLERAKLYAGVVSTVALVAMLVTSLFQAPDPPATGVLAVLAVGLMVAMSVRIARRRADRRLRTDP